MIFHFYFVNSKINLYLFSLVIVTMILFGKIQPLNVVKSNNVLYENNIIVNSEKIENNVIYSNEKITDINNFKNSNINNWKIEIPKINLEAKIQEGTSEKVLDEYVGHFEETKRQYGNIGLAAHNRGYRVNYFNRIKELNIGDKIYYYYNNSKVIYKVVDKKIIKDTNWKVLEDTKENYLTLITCMENKPEQRRCIIAKEVK